MKRKSVESVKTLLVLVLFIAMMMLALIYVLELRQSRLKGQNIPVDKMWIFRNEENEFVSDDDSLEFDQEVVSQELMSSLSDFRAHSHQVSKNLDVLTKFAA